MMWDGDEEVLVEIKVRMTPEQYERIRKDALWDGKKVGEYLVANALGETRRGC